jgi:hypothetical protein
MLFVLPGAGPSRAVDEGVRIELVSTGGDTVVEVRGAESIRIDSLIRRPPTGAGWAEIFPVHTAAASERGGELPPLLGEYSVHGDAIRFEPRFPLIPGETYVARWRGSSEPPDYEATASLFVPRPSVAPSTVVSAVYPSADVVPENLLRFYIEFSAPMSRGEAQRHIHLEDDIGKQIEAPFVAPERELWSPDRTRLTLFFDPGRIKRGVGPNQELGPPLREGERYRLVIDAALRDARGLPLARGHEKSFRAAAPDREQPSTEEWGLEPPQGPAEPLVISLPEPLDHGLLVGLLEVLNEFGESLGGEVTVSAHERRWSFEPQQPWGPGVYRLRVATQLEDLAGNSLLRPFEIVLAGSSVPSDRPRYVELPFSLP